LLLRVTAVDEDQKISLNLVGPKHGPPTLEDLIALSKRLTGRDPTAEEIEQARAILAGLDS
jgi:hypothetical protein